MSEGVSALRRSRGATRQAWRERLDRFATAQLSVAAFCRQEGVSTQAFYYWKRQLAPPAAAAATGSPRLLPVRLLAGPAPIELVLPSGAVLRLGPGCDLALVRSLVAALGGAPC